MNAIFKRTFFALTNAAVATLAIIYAPSAWIMPAFAVLIALASFEYFSLLKRVVRLSLSMRLLLSAGALLIVAGLLPLPLIAAKYGNLMMLYVIAVIKVSDMGGFALGKLSAAKMKGGNHKMCPKISPNKSWEGLFGSVLASCIVACAFIPLTGFGVPKSLAIGVTAALVGTAGDLVESAFKRWVGVKDSATFMPAGLGGFLDMLDSLLIAPAAIWCLL